MIDWRLELTVALLALIALTYFVCFYAKSFVFSKAGLLALIMACETLIGLLLSVTLYSGESWPSGWLRACTVSCVLGIGALGCGCHSPCGVLGSAANRCLKCRPR